MMDEKKRREMLKHQLDTLAAVEVGGITLTSLITFSPDLSPLPVETAMQAEQDALIEHPSGEGRGPKKTVCNHTGMKLVLYASSTSRV